MIKIDKDLGVKLMRDWGIKSWPDIETSYYLWADCGVFSLTPFLDGMQLDMAMSKRNRQYARDMVSDIMSMAKCVIYAPIIEDRKSVINLAKKMGFEYCADGLSTTGEKLKIYRRSGWVE